MTKSKILIVEDEAIAAMNLEAKLIALGYESAGIAFTGAEAIEKCRVTQPDLVLMDIKLKGSMDGIEAARLINIQSQTPIVYLTAFSDDATLSRAKGTAPFGYLVKPIRESAIRSTIEIALEKQRLQKCLEQLAAYGEFALANPPTEVLTTRFVKDVFSSTGFDQCLYFSEVPPEDAAVETCEDLTTHGTFLKLVAAQNFEVESSKEEVILPRSLHNYFLNSAPILVDDSHPLTSFLKREARNLGQVGSGVWMPIAVENRVHGIVVGYMKNPQTHSHQDVSFVMSMAMMMSHCLSRKNVESELRRAVESAHLAENAKRVAEMANNAKSAFLANMSHEIRTPLGAVLGFAEILAADSDVTQSDRFNFVSIMKRNGELLATVINDILDLSKIEAGKIDIEKIEFSLIDLLSEISESLNLQAESKGIDLRIHTVGHMIPSIVSDPNRLRQILLNIVGNAIKFTNQGFVDVKVQFVRCPVSAALKLQFLIRDTGCGIAKSDAARLFAPFAQADESVTRKYGGTGLGLVLSKRLAEGLGGDVALEESAPGVGSLFVVTIDPGISDAPLENSLSKESAPYKNEFVFMDRGRLEGTQVLLIEDNLDNQILIGRILRVAGAHVDIADNGQEGINKAQQAHYDIILMDIQMPVMDGYTAIATLRGRDLNTPIIALTARTMKDERERCLASGFNDHVAKPIQRKELLRKIVSLSKSGHSMNFGAQ